MARAHTIWVVEDANDCNVMAVFTVKHELVTWLMAFDYFQLEDVYIHTFHDGVAGRLKTMLPQDLGV